MINYKKIAELYIKDTIPTYSYIYIISDNNGYIKVGISKHPEKRLKQLQTGHPNNLTLLFTEEFECKRRHLLKIEKLIHRKIHDIAKHMKGEWFAIEDDQIEKIKSIIIQHRIQYDADPITLEYLIS
jgi:predicted GIY-YIG superfamily endonuclease